MAGSVSGGCVENAVVLEAMKVIASAEPILLHYGSTFDQAVEVGLPCGGEIDVFVEPGSFDDSLRAEIAGDGTVLLTMLEGPLIGRKLLVRPGVGAVTGNAPPALAEVVEQLHSSRVLDWRGQRVFAELFSPAPRLVIVGAVDLSEALAGLASSIGWRTVCIEPRAAFASSERVPSIDELRIEWPDEALRALDVDEQTAIVVLVHDEKFIIPALISALAGRAFYIGVLGSRLAQVRWRSELIAAGVGPEGLARLHGPAGLEIGAATPRETALSILGEILAVRNGRPGGFLRDGSGAIHGRKLPQVDQSEIQLAPLHDEAVAFAYGEALTGVEADSCAKPTLVSVNGPDSSQPAIERGTATWTSEERRRGNHAA